MSADHQGRSGKASGRYRGVLSPSPGGDLLRWTPPDRPRGQDTGRPARARDCASLRGSGRSRPAAPRPDAGGIGRKLSARRKDCAPLAGKSTLNRLELVGPALTRYHPIAWDAAKIEALFVDLFLEAHQPLYEEIYSARSDLENRIKESQLDLFADRTSAAIASPFRDDALRFEQAYSDTRRNFAFAVLWCHRVLGRRRARA